MEQKIITFSKENQVKVGRNLTIVGVTDDMLECVLFSSSLSKYVYIDIANLSDSLKNTIIDNYLCETKNVPTFDEFFLDVMTEVSKALATTDKPLDIRISTDPFNDNDKCVEIHSEPYEIDNNRANVLNRLAELIQKYGEENTLFTFDFCSQTGCELQNSTIDEIQYSPMGNDFLIMFNANTKDWAMIDNFSTEELYHFVNQLEIWLKEEED